MYFFAKDDGSPTIESIIWIVMLVLGVMSLVIVVKNKLFGSTKNSIDNVVEASNREFCNNKQDGSEYKGKYVDNSNHTGYYADLKDYQISSGEFKPLCEFDNNTVSLDYGVRGWIKDDGNIDTRPFSLPSFIQKGALIDMRGFTFTDIRPTTDVNDYTFRVLSVNESQVKLMKMTGCAEGHEILYDKSFIIKNKVTFSNGIKAPQYKNSNLDDQASKYNEYDFEIAPQNITQSLFKRQLGHSTLGVNSSYKGEEYSLIKTGEAQVGKRLAYALDISDINEYFGNTFTPFQLIEFVSGKNDTFFPGGIWLRSADNDSSDNVFIINSHGNIESVPINYGNLDFRLVMVMDLRRRTQYSW